MNMEAVNVFISVACMQTVPHVHTVLMVLSKQLRANHNAGN